MHILHTMHQKVSIALLYTVIHIPVNIKLIGILAGRNNPCSTTLCFRLYYCCKPVTYVKGAGPGPWSWNEKVITGIYICYQKVWPHVHDEDFRFVLVFLVGEGLPQYFLYFAWRYIHNVPKCSLTIVYCIYMYWVYRWSVNGLLFAFGICE